MPSVPLILFTLLHPTFLPSMLNSHHNIVPDSFSIIQRITSLILSTMVSSLETSSEWSSMKYSWQSRLSSTQRMHNVNCEMSATSVASSTMILKKSALRISTATFRKTCSAITFIILFWMSLDVHLSPFCFIQSFRKGSSPRK